ncbi:Fic family protein [Actinosynnema sp. NPDC051121]
MNETISVRATAILRVLAAASPQSRAQIEQATDESRISTIRELGRLVELGYVEPMGEARATRYAITAAGRTAAVWDVDAYLAREPDQRGARYVSLEPSLFEAVRGIVGSLPAVVTQAVEWRRRMGDSASARKDLERFVIELSWKSSKIEGNTYTLLDTERLILDAAEASGHPHAEAVMILGHKRAFDYIWQHQDDFRRLTRQNIEQVHELLTHDLGVPRGLRSGPVGITGTVYVPPGSQVEIASHLDGILSVANQLAPVERALACLVLLPYLQPFVDGNKRTSRLVANAVLLAHGYPPLSYRSIDEQAYKGALILFYEQGSLANFRELFLRQLEDAALNYFFPVDDRGRSLRDPGTAV